MKTKNLLFVLAINLTISTTYAQKDTAKIEYSQEKMTPANRLDQTICEVLSKRELKEKDLWKFNLTAAIKGFNISYERKIAPKWSYNINSISNFHDNAGTEPKSIAFSGNGSSSNPLNLETVGFGISSGSNIHFSQSLSFQLRNYYNSDKRTRLGKKAGFSGNYWGLLSDNTYSYFHFSTATHEYNVGSFSNSLNLIYGIQRKVGRVGYIDFTTGLGVRYFDNSRITAYPGGYGIGKNKEFQLNIPVKLGIGIAF